MDKTIYNGYIERIIKELGINGSAASDNFVSNEVESEDCSIENVRIKASISVFESGKCRVEINFALPKEGASSVTFTDYCARIEKTPRDFEKKYMSGPSYKSWNDARNKKRTIAIIISDCFFYVRSENYTESEIEEALENAIMLAGQFTRHIKEYPSLRRWNPDDMEVVQKAKEIIANARLFESDIDRECGAHFIKDNNSFMKGWFFPLRDKGRGTFDTLWPSSLDYAASFMGAKGSFEYAVAYVLLEDKSFIAKARQACVLRKENTVICY